MRALLLFNPTATTTDATVRSALVGLLDRELDLTVAATKARGHAVHLAAGAAHEGLDAVFALGGDGTANEAIQGLAGSDTALGLLPGGGANVLARGLGLPKDAAAAARVQLEALHGGLDRRVGLGRVNDRLFGFQVGIGFDAAVVRSVEQHPGTKRALRQLGFVWLALREWSSGEERHDPAVRLVLPGEPPGPAAMAIIVCNADPYTFLGPFGLHVTPEAHPDRGLATCEIRPVGAADMGRIILGAFRGGRHAEHPAVTVRQDVAACTVTAHRPVPVMIDGDYLGEHRVVRLAKVPEALRVLTDAATLPGPDVGS